MLNYTLRRFGLSIVIVAVAMSILFLMIHLVPGDPVTIALGPRATPEMREAYRARMGLDKPIHIQYVVFFANALRGDLGEDVFSQRAVTRIISEQLPHTAALVAASLLPFFFGLGLVYLALAVIGGAVFLAKSIALARAPGPAAARANFNASLLQLSLILVGAMADAWVPL